MKKIISMICLVMVLALLAMPVFAVSGSVSLSASSASLHRGDTFTVTARLNSSDAIALGTVLLSYDSSVFEMTGGSCHVSGTSVGEVLSAQKVGTFMLNGDPRVVSGNLFTFNMKVKDDAPIGSYTISSSSSIGVSTGEGIASGSVTVNVICNHSYDSWAEADNGHSQTCSECGNINTEDHKWNSGTVTKPATCKEEGEKSYKCTVCNAVKTEVLPKTNDHTFGNLTAAGDENHKDICSVCNQEIIQPHTWNKGVVTKKATCKEEGERTYTCTGCKHTKTEVIPILDTHTWGKWQKVDSLTHKRTCSVCEKEETGDHSYNTYWSKDRNNHFHECSVCKDQKDVEKHTPGPEATEKNPQICTVCKYVIKPALEHIHEYAQEWTTDEDGHWYICSGCEEKGEYADHDFENACDPDCSICGFTRETAHNYGDNWVTDGENHYHECTGCGDIQDKETHIPGAAATETEAQTCTVCGYELAPALGTPETDPADIHIVEKDDFPWWIIIVIAAAAVIAAAVVILKKKNKV